MFYLVILLIFVTMLLVAAKYGGGGDFMEIIENGDNFGDIIIGGLCNLRMLDINYLERKVLNSYIFSNNAEQIISSYSSTPYWKI